MRIPICHKTILASTLLLGTFLLTSTGVSAQDQADADADEVLDEIITTGSAIKREDLNNALPVQVITADQLDRQGITNAGDLIESVPAMQGFITPSDSVGGGGGGLRTANLRAIGSQYTLSLLNGRRMAPADSGSTIDLNNIPLAAVERVHVLTDGASALYGSDAIAGVVNFMLKDSVEGTTVSIRGDSPAESGGGHWNASVVTGFGDLESDGYGFVLSLSHERQDQLAAIDRDFARTGFIQFTNEGQEYYFQNSSTNAIPGNAHAYDANFNDILDANGNPVTINFNPFALSNGGTCPEQTTPEAQVCRFDYTSTLEVLPESTRDSLSLNGKVRLTDNLTGIMTVLASQYETINRIAPYPTGEIPLPLNSSIVQNEVMPHLQAMLTPDELAQVAVVTGEWRALPAGNRTTQYDIDSMNWTLGLEGVAGDMTYSVAGTYASTEMDQRYPTGWLLLDEFVAAASSGSFNIFAGQDEFSDSDLEALMPTVYSGRWDLTETGTMAFDAQATKPLFEMNGGEMMLAGGIDFRTTDYKRSLSEANQNADLLFLSSGTPFELERSQWGAFVEALFPITESFEVTTSIRYDDISAVSDELNSGDIDDGDSDTTYKISTLWNASDTIAVRASYGTGFKAPSMRQIGEPRIEFGVTSGTFDCPFPPTDPLAQYCRPGATQYNVFRQGYAGLGSEHSEQYTFGVVVTPTDNFDMTIDYWNIELEDLVQRLTEQQIFDNPDLYRDLFTTKTNQATGQEVLAIIQAAVNAGTREQSGIDYNLNYGLDLDWGQLDLGLQGTYMLESDSSLTGSSLGRFGNDDSVVFRNVMNVSASLYHGDFSHTLWANYRTGYLDQAQEVEVLGTGAPLGQGPMTTVQLDVPDYVVTNYQARYMMLDDSLTMALGISNLLDEEPPLSLRISGAGHQLGWDPRYTDGMGRTFYLQAEYVF